MVAIMINIIRLCANTGADLHLIEPLGLKLEDKQLKRVGLDYPEYANLTVHKNWADFVAIMIDRHLFAITTKGSQNYVNVSFKASDVFVFGPETRGLPDSRSLNLSNSAAVLLYEAWRQVDFNGGA